ncbi:MAG: monosaccharide-transporting ATPase [Solirubrobacterales bacterium]|nr:monosaccharide-transporting ATPase [Solirubrobacterales bacterium]
MPLLAVRNLSKTFAGQRALAGVDLDVDAGEVHALVGENGSGKSTLIKCLSGYHQPDAGGSVQLSGEPLDLPLTPEAARAAGMAFVHQDLGLVPSMTVMENLAIGRGYATGRGGRVKWRAERARARAVLLRFGHDVPPDVPLRNLAPADQTLVAIVRALQDAEQGGSMLVLDEPTAALPDREAERLFAAVREIAASGVGVIYISHRLHEVFSLADRVTVLRDGRRVLVDDVANLTERQLVRAIVGRDLEDRFVPAPAQTNGDVVLEAKDLRGRRLDGATFAVRAGEIVGVAGLLGSGRSELARIVAGAQAPAGGEIRLGGEPVAFRGPRDAIDAGVVLVPEDRRTQGAFVGLTMAENLTLPSLPDFFRAGRLRHRDDRRVAEELMEEFGIRPNIPGRRFAEFSGGNQQKAVIAKWLHRRPRVAVFDEPGQGVDVGSKAEIYRLVRAAAENGSAVLVVDSDLEELELLCHRVLVLRDGCVAAELEGAGLKRDRILEHVLISQEAAA